MARLAFRRSVLVIFVLGVLILLGLRVGRDAQASAATPSIKPSSVRLIQAPRGHVFYGPVWVPRLRALVVTEDCCDKVWTHHLYALGLDGSHGRLLRIPADPQCPFNASGSPALLPSGDLAFIPECFGNDSRLPERVKSLSALDPRTGRVRRLRQYYLPFMAGQASFSPTGGGGLVNDGRGLSERLEWLRRTRLMPLNLRLARAGSPRFSPDGRWIALDGVPKQQAPISPATSTLPRTLYLLSGDGKKIKPVLAGLTDVGRASWSSVDGRWLALALKPRDGPDGLWLVEAKTGRHFLVMRGRQFGATEWISHTGTVIVSTGVFLLIPGAPKQIKVGLYVIKLPPLARFASHH